MENNKKELIRINKDTLWVDFEPFLNGGLVLVSDYEKIKKVAGIYPYDFSDTKLIDIVEMSNGRMPSFLSSVIESKGKGITVFEVVSINNCIENFFVELSNFLKGLEIPLNPNEQKASNGLPTHSFSDSLAVFCVKTFGYKSYQSALENVSVREFCTAKKDYYITTMYDRNYANIVMNAK